MSSGRWRHLFAYLPSEAIRDPERWRRALVQERTLRTKRGAFEGLGAVGPFESVYLAGPGAPVLGARFGAALAGGGASEVTLEAEGRGEVRRFAEAWAAAGITRVALSGAAGTPDGVETARGAGLTVDVRVSVGGAGPLPVRFARERIQAGATSLSMEEAEAEDGDPARWLTLLEALEAEGWVLPDLAHAHAPDDPPRHPRAIRRREPVLGLGPGAVTFRSPFRQWNHRDPDAYLGSVEGGVDPRAGGERLDRAERRMERSWMALRTARGLRCPSFQPAAAGARAGPGPGGGVPLPPARERDQGPRPPPALLEEWRARGWIEATPGWIRPTPSGWLRADHLATTLVAVLEEKGPPAPSPGAPVP